MADILDDALKKVVKGTTIVFTGSILGMFLGFMNRTIIIRYITQTEYGLFSLANVLFNIFLVVASLGIHQGITRYIPYYKGKREEDNVSSVINSSIQMALVSGLFFFFVALSTSGIISGLFHEEGLVNVLRIFFLMIPFAVMNTVMIFIFMGFARVEIKAYFSDLIPRIFFFFFLLLILFVNLGFRGVVYSFVISNIAVCFILAFYTVKNIPFKKITKIDLKMQKKLLFFSLPLLAQGLLGLIMTWTDILMLGYFKTAFDVGLYNAALPVARLLQVFLGSMIIIYVPVVTELYSKNLMEELRRNYAILTKWTFSAMLPLFLIMFLFPHTLLGFLFGQRYVEAYFALKILSIGFFVNTFLGPNGATLIVMGRTKFLMYATLLSTIINICLNIILIPIYGFNGAAIASTASLVIINILYSAKLYSISKAHPFTKNYVKPVFTSILVVYLIYFVVKKFVVLLYWMFPIFFVTFLLVYVFSLLITRSFDNEDIMILLAIEKKLGIDAKPIKRILKRFI